LSYKQASRKSNWPTTESAAIRRAAVKRTTRGEK
jgi:hypothetical protein